MSHNKRGSGADVIYTNHLAGGQFASNPQNNRTAITERMYQRILGELATNRFKWTGFPEEIDIRFLELCLYYHAVSIFYFDEDYDKYMALQGGGTNYVNMLNNPVAFRVVGTNFHGKTISAFPDDRSIKPFNKKGAIPIWANYMRVPDLDIVMIYSQIFAELDRTVQINSKNARRSKVLVTTENTKTSIVNINRQIDEGQNTIQIHPQLQDLAFINAFDLGVEPKTIVDLHILKVRLWNECMGLLGIENSNQDKKERLVEDEVSANNDQTASMRYVNLNARRTAAKQINERFGLNVSVEYFTDEDREIDEDKTKIDED